MSEAEAGAEPREAGEEQQFGHVALQTYLGEVYSLNLYATYATSDTNAPGIVCRGYYLPPTEEIRRHLRRWEQIDLQAMPLSAPVEVVLATDAYTFNVISDMVLEAGYYRGEHPPDSDAPFWGDFVLRGPERGDFHDMYAQVSPPVERRGRTLWSGTLGGKGTGPLVSSTSSWSNTGR
ncbi:MAG: hypothetical protein ICV68_17795 [Pyrinomonadaceae bacterium]|nr:hypothetical protein [Pyrinomonadaceae bacterium]